MRSDKKMAILMAGVLVMFVFAAFPMAASAASEAEIEQAINNGTAWLAAQQNPDGSWGSGTTYYVGHTGLALTALGSHDPVTYSDNISSGLNFLFANAHNVSISMQTAGDPDTNGNGNGIVFYSVQNHEMYETGVAVMALAECGYLTPDAVVNVPGSDVNGMTYEDVLQDAVDFIAYAQIDSGDGRGGWYYTRATGTTSDNSIAGYVVMGIAYAISKFEYPNNIDVPAFVNTELDYWIDYIQNDPGTADDNGWAQPDGGSGYTSPTGYFNIYKTGNLLFQMALVGDDKTTPRVQNATDYIVTHWNDPCGWSSNQGWKSSNHPAADSDYAGTWSTMKGLEVFEIATIGDPAIDWFDEFTDVIVARQNPDGSWTSSCGHGSTQILGTGWALLTLLKEVPEVPEVGIDIEKTVLDPNTGNWADAVRADVGDEVRFKIWIHNAEPEFNMTNFVVNDTLSASLQYVADSATPFEPNQTVGNMLYWYFPDTKLEYCENFTIEFNATKAQAGDDTNCVNASAWCNESEPDVQFFDKDCVYVRERPSIEVNKTVRDSETLEWADAIRADIMRDMSCLPWARRAMPTSSYHCIRKATRQIIHGTFGCNTGNSMSTLLEASAARYDDVFSPRVPD